MLERVVDGLVPTIANGVSGARPTILDVVDVVQEFRLHVPGGFGTRTLSALSRVSFRVHEGETVGIVGESGSGKTTLARTIIQLPPPVAGQIWFRGYELTRMSGRGLRRHRSGIQMVFQDPFSSLNPKWCVADIVEEPLIGCGVTNRERRVRVEEILALVGLPLGRFGHRRPEALSGGQCQRVAIARAVVSRPALVVCDEAVSSLDALIQAQMLDLFQKLRREFSLSYLFISHDLLVVRQISDRIAVLHSGQLCEIGPTDAVFDGAGHPYTQVLLSSIPSTEPRRPLSMIKGDPPSPLNPPTGCRFRLRCPVAGSRCAAEEPQLMQIAPDHFVACHFPVRISPV
jgi:oligopeptide/dipeptide ABC transporter ATP-binding protein